VTLRTALFVLAFTFVNSLFAGHIGSGQAVMFELFVCASWSMVFHGSHLSS